ncbi:hypothetical protein CYCD_19710 [Tenuifilaceae bacterium CYCD]|nr:hypothetical protein CYCD_19710 [Tenuifilaceae bacterium CYCD]
MRIAEVNYLINKKVVCLQKFDQTFTKKAFFTDISIYMLFDMQINAYRFRAFQKRTLTGF